MQTKKLGNSDMEITRVGLGAWAIGGTWDWGWGAQEDQDSINTIVKAIESGINWIDTAPIYGLGHSEKVIAKALKALPNKPYIFTKCGLVWDEQGNVKGELTKSSVIKEAEDSLKRMDIDVIDLYQIHWPNPDEQIEEAWEAMLELQHQQKIRYLGASNFSIDQMNRVKAIGPLTSLQPQYNLVTRDIEKDILPYCLEQNIGVINYAPMASGLLTGKMSSEHLASLPDDDWRKDPEKAPQFAEPKFSRNMQLVELLKEIANKHSCSVGEVAIAWTLHHDAISGAIVGQRKPEQVEGIIRAGDIELSDSEINTLTTFVNDNP